MGCAIGVGGHAGVDDVHTSFDSLQVTHGRHTGCKMTVQMNGGLDRCFEGLDDFIGIIRGNQAGHVLDTDAVGSHCLQVFGLLNIIFEIVNLTTHTGLCHGVADTPLKMFAAFLYHGNNGFKITIIVQGIKCPEDIHTVCSGPLHKGPGQIIRIISISHQILGPQQHGERCFLHVAFQGADSFPGILIQKAVHGIKGCPTPGFNSPESHFVHHLGHRNHVFGSSASGK